MEYFTIAISLMSYNEGILIDENNPVIPFEEWYLNDRNGLDQPHTPHRWMQNSCVWFSQFLTQEFGMRKLKKYLKEFNYGNQNVSGDKGQVNGLTYSWESSSLEISPKEQAIFLQKLLDNKLPVSKKSHEMTKKILFLEDLTDGWKLYGKTGSGYKLSSDRTQRLKDQKFGWFIGWIQKGERKIIFVQYSEVEKDQKYEYGSILAKEIAKKRLNKIISLVRFQKHPQLVSHH